MWQTRFGRCIYNAHGAYQVYQNIVYRWLCFGNDTIQTLIHRYYPHKPMLDYLQGLSLMARLYPGRSCLLGLGGGSIIHLLGQRQAIVAVEQEAEIIQIAAQYFMINSVQGVSIVHDTAQNYLSQTQSPFQHLLIDLYNADHYPRECATLEFFLNCRQALEKNGFLSINLANTQDQWPIFQLIKHVFSQTLLIPSKQAANLVIIASNQSIQVPHSIFKKIEWASPWGKVARLR